LPTNSFKFPTKEEIMTLNYDASISITIVLQIFQQNVPDGTPPL